MKHALVTSKFTRMPWLVFLLSSVSLVVVDNPTYAQDQYELVRANPIDESWRWHELEALGDLYLSCGAEDEEGSLWFGYEGGVLSYDGSMLERFLFPEAFSNAKTICIFPFGEGYYFVFTSQGLLRFGHGKWTVLLDYESNFTISRILAARNSHGLVVLATPLGLYQIDKDTIRPVDGMEEPVSGMAFDNDDNLWLAMDGIGNVVKISDTGRTLEGNESMKIYRFCEVPIMYPQIVYNERDDELLFHTWRPDVPAFLYDESADEFTEESVTAGNFHLSQSGSISVGRYGFLLFTKSAVFSRYKGRWSEISVDEEKLPASNPYGFQRQNGNLVLGGHGEPIYEIDYAKERWDSFPGLHFQGEGRDGRYWFISLEGGIVEYDPVSEVAVLHSSGTIEIPHTLLCASDGTIWAAGAHEGVAAVCYYDGQRWTRDLHPNLGHYISYLSAIELASGEIAFGSGSEYVIKKGGMVVYRPDRSEFDYSYVLSPKTSTRIVGMAQTDPGHLWIGGPRLARLKLPGYTEESLTNELAVRWIDHVSSDHEGGLWIATWERGLFHFKGGVLKKFGRKEGLDTEQVTHVLNDRLRTGTLWVATRMGISRLENGLWINDVLPLGVQFLREGGTLKQDSDGAIWINIAKRDWYFRTENSRFEFSSLKDDFKTVRYNPDSNPPIVRFQKFATKTVAPANIPIAWEGEDFWSITPREKLEYSYQLDNNGWSPFSNDTSVVLSDLSKGNHSFELRVRDLDGNVSHVEQAATFSVIPPLWQRSWFLLSALFTVLTIVALVILLIRQRVRNILQLDEFKLQFFTNLSHELRTPIGLILGPLEQFMSRVPENLDTKPLEIVQRNAQKLHHLVEQILEFRRLEVSNAQSHLSHADLIQVIKESIRAAKPLSKEKRQNVFLVSQQDTCLVWFDTDAVDKILGNLILNAIKYTDEGGEIVVKLTVESESDAGDSIAIISVEDNGMGIPEEKVSHIFEPFYQADNSLVHKNRGSGLGLALTKNLVERCGGSISVNSPICIKDGKPKGARFEVTLPLKARRLTVSSNEESPKEAVSENLLSPESNFRMGEETEKEENLVSSDKPSILVVEDDDDMRAFLKSELENEFVILEASDGNSGLRVAVKEIPDLIISDVMMPEMDGNEFCQRIKNDETTSHIPIFMLTALKASDHELKSLDRGADSFFTKPVNISVIRQRIRNVLEFRSRLHERYQLKSEPTFDAKSVTSNNLDETFLHRAIRNIEENLGDVTFDVEALAGLMHMSRMTLYRKFKAITGESPSDCIRRMRLEKASSLLESGALNVSEVSDEIGILDVSYFCTLFKKYYGVTPGEYMAKFDVLATRE